MRPKAQRPIRIVDVFSPVEAKPRAPSEVDSEVLLGPIYVGQPKCLDMQPVLQRATGVAAIRRSTRRRRGEV